MSTQLQNFYPRFVPNQVLTDTQLNHLRQYLDEQHRFTRTHMIGTGIVCGLNATYTFGQKEGETQESHSIYVSKGFGVSSEGYVLGLEEAQKYTHFREFEGLDQDEDGHWDYLPWERAREAERPIYELLPAGPESYPKSENEVLPLQEEYIDCRVLVLYLEKRWEDLRSCAVTDCSNKGAKIQFEPRVLLVHEMDLKPFEVCEPVIRRQLELPRFHTALQGTGPNKFINISTRDHINQAYGNIVQKFCEDDMATGKKGFRTILIEAGEMIQNFLYLHWDITEENVETIPKEIKERVSRLKEVIIAKESADDYNQYHYGFIRDLVCAYNEFLKAYCELVKNCWVPNDFPCHLMIRRFFSETKTLTVDSGDGKTRPQAVFYRHKFQPASTKNARNASWAHTRKLFLRILAMIEHFDDSLFGDDGSVTSTLATKFTPSNTLAYPLGKRSIPFYYTTSELVNGSSVSTSLVNCWQPTFCCTDDKLQAYNLLGGNFASRENVWNVDIEKNTSFIQIEGHLGKPCIDAVTGITQLRVANNLNFHLIVLTLGDNGVDIPDSSASVFQFLDFVNLHTGLEHLGGVERGDTFILVCDTNINPNGGGSIVADFTLKGYLPSSLIGQLGPEKIAPSSPKSSSRKSSTTSSKDDLKRIQGIGPSIEKVLNEAGITSYQQLASTGVKELQQILDAAGSRFRSHDPGSWALQAKLAETSQWDALELVKKGLEQTEAEASTTSSRSVSQDASTQSAEAISISAEQVAARKAKYVKSLMNLNQDGSLAKNTTYRQASDFVGKGEANLEAFDAVMKMAIRQFKRSSGERKIAYHRILEETTYALLDAIAFSSPDELQDTSKDSLSQLQQKMSDAGMDVAKIRQGWKGKELIESGKPQVINQINRILK